MLEQAEEELRLKRQDAIDGECLVIFFTADHNVVSFTATIRDVTQRLESSVAWRYKLITVAKETIANNLEILIN